MLGHLIRKEILDQLLSLRFIILSVISAIAIWLSLYDGYAYYQDRVRDFRAAQTMTEERIEFLKEEKSFFELRMKGFMDHKPPSPLCIFIRGLDPILGRSISNAENQDFQMTSSPMESEPILSIFPPLDLGLVVQVVLGLFVLLSTYDVVCGEKEAGTLCLAASFPVPRHRLLLGKLIGISVPVLAAFGLPLLLGIAVLLVMPDVEITLPEWGRLIVILETFGLYLSALMCAGLFASCLTHRSATSFVLLLSFWVATVVVVPRLSLIAAEVLRPMPTLREQFAKRHTLWESMEFVTKPFREWEKENPDWRKTPEGREARQIHYWESGEEVRANIKIVRNHFDEWFEVRYNARLNLASALARLSPAFAFHNAVVRLAGTGIDRHRRFKTTFKRDYLRVLWAWLYASQSIDGFRENWPAKYGYPNRDFSDMPRLTYRETWPEAELQESLIDVALLALWGLAFFVGAYVAMLRYDLR